MSYSQGGLIEATDYNNFLNGSNQLNTVWGTGSGDAGYGQTNLSTVSQAGTVTATQWATLINTLNTTLTHQSGSGSGISATTAGSQINYLNTLATSVNTAYTNRALAGTNGTDITGAAPAAATWNSSAPTTFQIVRTATFASADAARYFFNAGGKLILTFSSSNTLGNSKGADWVTLLNTKMASMTAAWKTNARNGTGGTVSASNTALGYWTAGTTNNSIITLTSASGTADYGTNAIAVGIKTNGQQGGNGDVGTVFTFTIDLTDSAADTNTAPSGWDGVGTAPDQGNFNDQLDLSITTNITVRPPESSNLTNSWGTVTIG